MERLDGVFIKIFVDDLERYQKLSDAEYGRLVRAGLTYRATFAEPSLSGRESLMWDGMKLDIDRDIKRYENLKTVRTEASQKAVAAKAAKRTKRNQTLANVTKRNQTLPNDTDIDTDIDIDIGKDIDGNVSLTESHRAGAELENAIDEFISYRKKLKKPMTDRAVSMLKTRLEKLAPGNDQLKIQLLETSIYKGWLDVYPPDEEKTPITSNPFLQYLMEGGGEA